MIFYLPEDLEKALFAIENGEVIAYPTESVFGLGGRADNSQVIESIQKLKGRNPEKRFLIVAKDWAQIQNWVNVSEPQYFPERPTTYLYPASKNTPKHLILNEKIAIRISRHSTVKALCRQFPLISTSANISGLSPAKNIAQVIEYFPEISIVAGETNPEAQVSQIIDYLTGEILRS